MTDCIEPQLHFSFYSKQKLLVRFDGGEMTSDAGLLLLRQFDHPECAPKAGLRTLLDFVPAPAEAFALRASLRRRLPRASPTLAPPFASPLHYPWNVVLTGVSYHSKLKSLHCGLLFSISATFFSRFQSFNCFSRAIALETSP